MNLQWTGKMSCSWSVEPGVLIKFKSMTTSCLSHSLSLSHAAQLQSHLGVGRVKTKRNMKET